EVNEQVQSEIKKLQDRTSAQTLEKELKNLTPKERITRIRERIADDTLSAPLEIIETAVDRNVKDVTEESYNQLDEAFKQVSGKGLFSTEYAELSRIVTTLKKEWDKALEPAREEAKALAAAQKAETRTKQTDKDSHLTAIAKAVAQDNPVSIKQALEEYKSWRKTQGLSETTDEKALKAAGAEFYRDKAETELKREAEVQAAKERKEREAKAKAAKKAIKKQFGLDEDAEFKAIDTRVLNPMEFNEDFGDVLWQLTNVKAIGLNGLIKLLHVAYPGKGNYVDGLTKLLGITSKIVAKHNKKGLEIYTASIPKEVGMSGFHMYDRQQRKQILVINNNFLMVETAGGVAAHEAIHAIVAAIIDQLNLIANIPNASGIFVPKSYGNSWREFHHQVSQLLTALSTDIGDMYTTLTRKAESGEKLNGKETAFVALMSAYVAQYDPKLKPFDSKEGLAVLIKDFYAKGNLNYFLTNTDELLAEAFSNPYVTGILSIFESPFAPTTGKTQSYFRQIFDQLVEMVNQLIKLLKLPHIENNYFKALSNYMETMEDIAFNREEDTDWNIQHPIDGVGEVLNEFHAMAMVNNPINRLTPQLKTLINYIANAWYKRADIVSLEGVERELEAINAKTTKNKFG
ncbi:MAG TPA: hypothetical protein VGD26_03750, partial [Chitinophagaceae bacterium]